MPASVLERLRTALAPHYSVERELASGGMGTVFLGRDQGLDRPVAIKLLRPELATAAHAERFLREARVLARLSHPNIVPIHDVGEADGLYYYIMDYLTGETLYQRLTRGGLSPAETTSLALDLLAALDAAHRRGVVHRDLKPGNIFLVEGRGMLTDFGVAKSLDPAESSITASGTNPGTLAYMAPEQLSGGAITPRTDLYALGIVMFEALTGRRWWIRDQRQQTDWSGVPAPLGRILRKALAWKPEDRWASAAEFRAALRARSGPPRRSRVLWVLGAATVLVLGLWWLRPPAQPPRLAAILPFQAGPGVDSVLAANLTALVVDELHDALPLYSDRQSELYAAQIVRDSGRSRGLSAVITARLVGRPDSLRLRLTILQPGGAALRLRDILGDSSGRYSMSFGAAREIMFALVPELHGFDPRRGFSQVPRALSSFAEGIRAFRQDRWKEAQRAFEEALGIDSNFAMASWRLVNVRRWRRIPFGVDVRRLYQEHGSEFGEKDQLLIRAQTEPDLKARFADYQLAVDRYPYDGYAALLYADELFHRGPLAGRGLTEALNMFEHAVRVDSLLAPAYDHIIWGYSRLGDRAAAQSAYQRMKQVVPRSRGGGDLDLTLLMGLVLRERFAPDSRVAFGHWEDTAAVKDLIESFRWGIAFDIPRAQLKYGRIIASRIPYPEVRASGHNGEAIALIALGRPAAAFAQFDSAYRILQSPASDLLRAEWRVLPAALGLLPRDTAEEARGRRWLASDPLSFRAQWALAVADLMAGDSGAASMHAARVKDQAATDQRAQRLAQLFAALESGHRGRYDEALAISEPLLQWDSGGRSGDPFARAILHLARGQWLDRMGRPKQAYSEWLWHDNTDLEGWPVHEVQAGEVDWSFGTLGRLWQARALLATGRTAEACRPLHRVLELWSDAEPALRPRVDSARALARKCPP